MFGLLGLRSGVWDFGLGFGVWDLGFGSAVCCLLFWNFVQAREASLDLPYVFLLFID